MNIRSQVQHQQPREPITFERRATNGRMEVLDAIRDTIAALVRSGGLDSEACEGIARRTLGELHRLTDRQAATLWSQYAK